MSKQRAKSVSSTDHNVGGTRAPSRIGEPPYEPTTRHNMARCHQRIQQRLDDMPPDELRAAKDQDAHVPTVPVRNRAVTPPHPTVSA